METSATSSVTLNLMLKAMGSIFIQAITPTSTISLITNVETERHSFCKAKNAILESLLIMILGIETGGLHVRGADKLDTQHVPQLKMSSAFAPASVETDLRLKMSTVMTAIKLMQDATQTVQTLWLDGIAGGGGLERESDLIVKIEIIAIFLAGMANKTVKKNVTT